MSASPTIIYGVYFGRRDAVFGAEIISSISSFVERTDFFVAFFFVVIEKLLYIVDRIY